MEELALREAALLARPATPDRAPAEEEHGRIRMQQEIRRRTGGAGDPPATVVFPPVTVVFRRGEVRGLAAGQPALEAEKRRASVLEARLFDGGRPEVTDPRFTNCIRAYAASQILSLQTNLMRQAQVVRLLCFNVCGASCCYCPPTFDTCPPHLS